MIQAGRETLHSEIHKLIKLIWNKAELPHQWKESIVVPIHKRVIQLNVIFIGHIIVANFIQNFIEHSSL
jgi:hypothetical protein